MPGLDPGIHSLKRQQWIPGSSPGMTKEKDLDQAQLPVLLVVGFPEDAKRVGFQAVDLEAQLLIEVLGGRVGERQAELDLGDTGSTRLGDDVLEQGGRNTVAPPWLADLQPQDLADMAALRPRLAPEADAADEIARRIEGTGPAVVGGFLQAPLGRGERFLRLLIRIRPEEMREALQSGEAEDAVLDRIGR